MLFMITSRVQLGVMNTEIDHVLVNLKLVLSLSIMGSSIFRVIRWNLKNLTFTNESSLRLYSNVDQQI